jgi:DNA-binding MarR family transcriptional regulator
MVAYATMCSTSGNAAGRESIGRLVSCLSRHIHAYLERTLDPYGIGSGQFPFLMRLYKNDSVSQETLARLLDVDKATSARAIKKLEDTGYVRRERDTGDGRAYRVVLTGKGKSLEPAMRRISNSLHDTVLAGFSERDRRLTLALLDRMIRNITPAREKGA